MHDALELPEPWCRPTDERAQALRREALLEIGLGHQLAGRRLTTLAVCEGCDDVLFRLDDGSFAIVHLTWTSRQESSPWPTTRRMASVPKLLQAAREHDH